MVGEIIEGLRKFLSGELVVAPKHVLITTGRDGIITCITDCPILDILLRELFIVHFFGNSLTTVSFLTSDSVEREISDSPTLIILTTLQEIFEGNDNISSIVSEIVGNHSDFFVTFATADFDGVGVVLGSNFICPFVSTSHESFIVPVIDEIHSGRDYEPVMLR